MQTAQGKSGRGATMGAIAVRAGVSRTTVSFVLNDGAQKSLIPEETCRRVLEAASELGYRRNSLARAIATGRSKILGFVGHGQAETSEFQWRLLKGVSEEAKGHGYLIKMLLTSDPELAARNCLEWRLDGLLTVTIEDPTFAPLQAALREHAIPLALLEDEAPLQEGIRAHTDYRKGLRLIVEHLAALGHRDIAYISGSPETFAGQARAHDFRHAAASLGIVVPPKRIARGHWSDEKSNIRAAHELLAQPSDRPTAIVCAGDPTAMGVLCAARELGLSVPDELSVTGFADFMMARYAAPGLTTVAQPFEEVGATAVRRLIALIESPGDTEPADKYLLEPRLIVRGSTAVPRP